MWQRVYLIYCTGHFAIYVRRLFGWCYISSIHSADKLKKSETAVPWFDSALSVLVMLVSGNVFHVVSALQTIVFIRFLFGQSGLL